MTPYDVIQSDAEIGRAVLPSEAILDTIIHTAPTPAHAVVAMFAGFIGACLDTGFDAGYEFEKLLAHYEDRTAATHRAPRSLQ